jgi:hypothetical protein
MLFDLNTWIVLGAGVAGSAFYYFRYIRDRDPSADNAGDVTLDSGGGGFSGFFSGSSESSSSAEGSSGGGGDGGAGGGD